MSRDLTAAMAAAIGASTVRPILLFEGEFSGGTINIWTGIGTLSWDSKTWSGIGSLLGVSRVEETDEIKAAGIVITLGGVRSADIALALAEMRRNRPGRLWLGLLSEAMAIGDPETDMAIGDPATGLMIGLEEDTLIADPKIIFRGRLDVCVIEDGADTARISISYENELIDLERPRTVRFTDEEQRRLYPGDDSLQYVASLQDTELRWGNNAG
jgi:hypothetical protein